MIDCLDKQQAHQPTRQESVFWSQQQPPQPAQQQLHSGSQSQQLPLASSLPNGGGMLMTNRDQKKHLLVDIEQAGQLDELENSAIQQQQQPQQPQGANNDLIGYYFGSISRETAEWILKNHGNRMDGAYLLRSSGPKDDFVLSLMVVHELKNGDHAIAVSQQQQQQQPVVNNIAAANPSASQSAQLEVLHYKIVETDDSFVALHGQVGDEKFATIDELIEKAQGVATKPKWPIQRQSLESQILPPTFWGLTVDQIRLAILIKAKQWGFPLSIFQQPTMLSTNTYSSDQQQQQSSSSVNLLNGAGQATDNGETVPSALGGGTTVTTLDNETIRTLIYKSLHEFQPWFHGRIGRDEAERRIEDGQQRDGRFLVRERDNYSYAMCISHKRTTKHYRIDVLSTGELAIQDGRKFTSLMALVSHYTIMSDGLWCALTEPCPRPIQQQQQQVNKFQASQQQSNHNNFQTHSISQQSRFPNQICAPSSNQLVGALNQHNNNIYCVPPPPPLDSNKDTFVHTNGHHMDAGSKGVNGGNQHRLATATCKNQHSSQNRAQASSSQALMCPNQSAAVLSIKAPIKEWLHTINHKWSQLIASKTNQQHQSLNSFLFGPSNPLNNHCRHRNHHHHHRKRCKNNCSRHNQQQDQTNQRQHRAPTGKNNNISQQQQQALILNGNCNCCSSSGSQALQAGAMLQNRLSLGGAGGDSLRSLPGNKLVLQAGVGGSGALTATQTQTPIDQTKMLLSCLPQNSGFMLDSSQSFIGSPLFVVKTNSQGTPIDGSIGSRPCLNGAPGSRSSGSNNSGDKGDNNIERLISPAQSISANLNGYQGGGASNPYALNTDIYGSQTSTAIVNDHLLTSSSSSSGNNQPREQQQRQSSIDLKYNPSAYRRPMGTVQNPLNSTIRYGTTESGRFAGPFKSSNGNQPMQDLPQFNTQGNNVALLEDTGSGRLAQARFQPARATAVPIQHAGPILCGQHAGPAYRYTNCTGTDDSDSFRPCLHSASMAISNNRAVDDLHLPTASSQLAGPAALTKFVQFQDGQCLRTHRDTKSIQMAYLLSRQEALNVLNNRGPSSRLHYNQSNQQQQHQQLQSHNFPTGVNSRNRPHEMRNNFATTTTTTTLQNEQSRAATQQQADFDLIDCDGSGFQFKYDPKLIKSSSIETLCGAGDNDDDAKIIEDLSNFKSNSELLMSLQPCWSSYNAPSTNNDFQSFASPLIPMSATNGQQQQSNDTITDGSNQASVDSHLKANDGDCQLRSLLYDTSLTNQHSDEHQANDSWNRKHNLDELTTSMLAELTASLKAQVDLKNKQSGLSTSTAKSTAGQLQDPSQSHGPSGQFATRSDASTSGTNGDQGLLDPLKLINEFDTLIRDNR